MKDDSLQEALIDNYLKQSGCISKEQVSKNLFIQWRSLVELIFSAAKYLLDMDWSTRDERRVFPESQAIWEALSVMYDLIGEVDGLKIVKRWDFDNLVMGYANEYEDSIDIFRQKIENCFAREIIIHKNKTKQMLEDDAEDRRLINRMRRYRQQKQRCKQKEVAVGTERTKEENPIALQFNSFVVLGNVFRCNKNHSIEQIRAIVEIVTPQGEKLTVELSAGYCKKCQIYFLLEQDFKRAREKGVLLCQLVSYERYEKNMSTGFNSAELRAESILHQSGYNVSAADNLTTLQRQEILRRVIDNKLYSISGVLSFLDWLIARNKKVRNKNMDSALNKWEEDREYVAQYRSNEHMRVDIERIDYVK